MINLVDRRVDDAEAIRNKYTFGDISYYLIYDDKNSRK